MKKLYLVLAVLLALALVACDNFATPDLDDGPRVMVTEDGRTFVNLGIGLVGSDGRALTDNLSRVAAERYEVAFFYNGPDGDGVGKQVYRATWVDGQRGHLWVETNVVGVNYGTGTNGNIMLIGSDNGTLLATGVLTSVDGSPGTTIFANSSAVTFAVTPLLNNIHGSAIGSSTPVYANSSLQIQGSSFTSVTLDGVSYPAYVVPRNNTLTATYTIEDLPADGIVVQGNPEIIPRRIASNSTYETAADVTGSFSGLTIGGVLPTSGTTTTFNLTLITKSNHGLIRIAFDIPVNAWSTDPGYNPNGGGVGIPTTDTSPGTWHIRGGIANTNIDQGIYQDSDGGAVLLAIGTFTKPDQTGIINVQ